jgi:hypothetical protein
MGRLSDFTPVEADFPDLADVPAEAEFTFVADGKDYNVTLAQMPELLGVGAVPSDDGGDVVGPSGATTGHAVVFNGATGKVVASAGAAPALIGHTQLLATITDAGNAASKNVGTTAGTVAAGDDSRFAATAGAPLASPTFTGVPAGPTAAVGTDTTQIATTAYVKAEITSVALTDGAGAAAAIAAEAGVSKVLATDASGDPDYLDIDNVDEATLAQLMTGEEGVIPSAATLLAAREWTAISLVSTELTISWTAALNRTITVSASFALTFDGLGAQVGDRLSGGLYVTNSNGSTITITVTNGDGTPDAPTVLPDAATTIDVTAGDTALIHFETLPDGTVFVLHRITI